MDFKLVEEKQWAAFCGKCVGFYAACIYILGVYVPGFSFRGDFAEGRDCGF